MVVQRVDRPQPAQPGLLGFRQRRVRRAHVGDAGAAAVRRYFDAVKNGRGRWFLPVGVIGMPTLGRLLPVAVPDQSDIGMIRHVALRVMLPHRGDERLRRREVLFRSQRLIMEHQRQMLRQRADTGLRGASSGWLRSTPETSAPSEAPQRVDRDRHGVLLRFRDRT